MIAEVQNWDLREKIIQLLVQGMLACARARTWMPVE
jgi:hypothetical protein